MKHNRLILTLGLLAAPFFEFAQNSYSFSKIQQSAYGELSGDSIVVFNSSSPSAYEIPGLTGEKFTYYDTVFTIGGQGAIYIGKSPFVEIDNLYSSVIIDGAFTQIDSIGQNSKRSYKRDGGPGNYIVKVQYKNWKLRNGPAGNWFNLQFWLHQKTGVVELRYGAHSANNSSGYTISSGPNIGMFFAPYSFSSCYQKLWCKGSPANVVLDSTANLVFHAMSGLPDSGTVYRFTPRTKTSTVSLGKRDNNMERISLMPNPATECVRIQDTENNVDTLEVYDTAGKLVGQIRMSDHKVKEMDVSGLKEGIYTLVLKIGEGQSVNKKLLVHRP